MTQLVLLTWVWAMSSSIGLIYSMWELQAARKDRAMVYESRVNGAKVMLVTTDVRRAHLLGATFILFTLIGWVSIWSIYFPFSSPIVRILIPLLVRFAIVGGVMLLTLERWLTHHIRGRLMEML